MRLFSMPWTAGLLALVAATALSSSLAFAQSANDVYALRQDLRNDSYVWEPMLKRAMPQQSRQRLVNPGARAQRMPQASPRQMPMDRTAESVMRYYGKRREAMPQPVAPRRYVSQASYTEPANERPFDEVTEQPTVTAYLGLFREEFEESTPNYYTFVRPQLQRERAAQKQQIENEQLRRRNGRSVATAPRVSSAAAAGNASRYGDTGQYYNTWTR
ncbi:MAG: hypothetical protein AAGF31_08745 [Planctomycetota bacterium]